MPKGGARCWPVHDVRGRTAPVSATWRPIPLLLLTVLLAAACGKKMGDECKSSYDCQEEDDLRTCDISQPGGYCTIEGCDEKSCPSEAWCIRFFPRLFLNRSCDPAVVGSCGPDDICLPDKVCAPRNSERRYCALSCDDNDDCRAGYECREAGQLGTLALTRSPTARARFCAPRDRPR